MVDINCETKSCSKCKNIKPLGEFNKRADRPLSNTYRSWCKKCTQENETLKSKTRHGYRLSYYARKKDQCKDRLFKKKYGISLADVARYTKEQEGKCLICQKVPDKLYVDHDHKTGKYRGLLCQHCNFALGLIFDDLNILKRMENYLCAVCSIP